MGSIHTQLHHTFKATAGGGGGFADYPLNFTSNVVYFTYLTSHHAERKAFFKSLVLLGISVALHGPW